MRSPFRTASPGGIGAHSSGDLSAHPPGADSRSFTNRNWQTRPGDSQGVSQRFAPARGGVENHWGREEFLEWTCNKAGLSIDAWKLRKPRCTSFRRMSFPRAAIRIDLCGRVGWDRRADLAEVIHLETIRRQLAAKRGFHYWSGRFGKCFPTTLACRASATRRWAS